MAFSGTQQKCKACDKTVYVVDLVSADGVSYHKACFKCNHCKGTLKLSNFSSLDGVLYCKPHFEQLFKETGSFTKSFTSSAKSAEMLPPGLTRSPSKAASMFSGTQEKCATCGKIAYPLEKLSNFSSLEGVLYCNPHFEQLLKENGSFNKSFTSPAKSADKLPPGLTRSPSKAAGMFSGTQEKCATCGKTAYPLEKVTVESQAYHKSCFKCSHGGCPISPSNYAALEGILYCKHHFKQLFKEKGSYNHLIKCASIKRTAASFPDL
ncbi:LIM domain-containing protein WLIM2b-like [Tasmannia lanceolata]|uniref:LIM domain-containing protein WLIM2b-like n=1 Tax=Tasmannia lanceolata TaxID=3420 RepID=UPI0040639B32